MSGEFDRYRGIAEALAEEFDLLDIAAAAAKLVMDATRGEATTEDERDLPQWEPAADRPSQEVRGPRKRRDRAEGAPEGGRGRGGPAR